jgi:hypothetical protein
MELGAEDTGPRATEPQTSRYAIKALDKNHADFDLPSLEKEVMILKKVTLPLFSPPLHPKGTSTA